MRTGIVCVGLMSACSASPRAFIVTEPASVRSSQSDAKEEGSTASRPPDSVQKAPSGGVVVDSPLDRAAFDRLPPDLRRWEATPGPACSPKVVQTERGIVARLGDDESPLPEELQIYGATDQINVLPYNSRAVLLSLRSLTVERAPEGEHLWLYECSGSHRTADVFAHADPHVTFGQVALAPDGYTLFHPGPEGVHSLDLRSLEHLNTVVLTLQLPRRGDYRPGCWSGPRVDWTQDYPIAWKGDELLLRRTAPCGFEGDPEAQLVRVKGLLSEEGVSERVLSPIMTVAHESNGRLWIGDGGPCESMEMSPSTGLLWSSDDQGQSWESHLFSNRGKGARQLFIRGATIVALTQLCSETTLNGGELRVSLNGGARWLRVPANEALLKDLVEPVGSALEQIEVLSYTPLRVRAWRTVFDPKTGAENSQTWEVEVSPRGYRPGKGSRAQADWKLVHTLPRPRISRQTQVGGTTFLATSDGLVRERNGKKETVFRPVDYWISKDRKGHSKSTPHPYKHPLAMIDATFESGCRSRENVLRSDDIDARAKVRGHLSVVGVEPTDHLSLRHSPSAVALRVAKISHDAHGLRPTGNVCKLGGHKWFQLQHEKEVGWVSGRFVVGATTPHESFEEFRSLLQGVSTSSADEFAKRAREAWNNKFLPQGEGRRETSVLSVVSDSKRATVRMRTCCNLDDSVSGQIATLTLERRASEWVLKKVASRDTCYRGVSTDGKRCI